jgi:hypothetical protein
MDSNSKILNVNFILLIKCFFNLVNFSHILKFKILGRHSRAQGAEVVVLPTADHDRIGCFSDQVKLTRALVRDLEEAIKKVNLLARMERKSARR